jgi:hypothetical protein
MNVSPHNTRLAVLGTMSDLHREPIAYDLNCLQKIIAEVSPDLLCAEITLADWERADLSQASLEIREALAPIIAATDIVLIPVAASPRHFGSFLPESGWRRRLIKALDRLLRWGQLRAATPENINGPWFGAFCHSMCWLTERFWTAQDRAAWDAENRELVENVARAIERDRGRRVLLVVQCQRLHQLITRLHSRPDQFTLVSYRNL